MEKRNELELLKQEISELKKENKLLNIKTDINEIVNESYSTSFNMGVWLEISFKETNNYGLVFHIESNNDLIKIMNDKIEIGYIEIYNWFERNKIEFSKTNLIKCLNNIFEYHI